ncbi:hypothetical protein like AT5G51980 [Hibiscus trionum]|uniref:C3H1-type domain-containing protein n=1 Tax=Hibiscus trionum TaxID=183268 RepID=A0A9W7IEL5_HIBTR|nr:hypothetical protein like AT5G51980 [Hibiscus trionum]
MGINEVHGRRQLPRGNVFRRDTKLSQAASVNPRKSSSVSTIKPEQNTPCKYWMSGNCLRGEKCWYLHSWRRGDGFATLARLEGHKKAVRGIAHPSGFDKLYSGSSDGTLRMWDGYTGKCVHLTNLGDEVGSLITEGPLVFIGMKNVVKVLNIHSEVEFNLKGPIGQVFAMTVVRDMLVAGAQNGGITAWRASFETNTFQPAASLEGHVGAVKCFAVGEKTLFCGSVDHTIRVWDLDTFRCIETLNGHAAAVTSLVHCGAYLFSCSLDCTIKVWSAPEGWNWEVVCTHNVGSGALKLCGMNDAENEAVLFCSCNDNTVRLYELPSFVERGRIFSKREVKVIERGSENLFFTGDDNGSLTVWKWQKNLKKTH